MNRYQRAALKGRLGKDPLSDLCARFRSQSTGKNAAHTFEDEKDLFTIIQDEDIFSTKYLYAILKHPLFVACYYFKNNAWHPVESRMIDDYEMYALELDFEDRAEQFKICFANGLAEDYVFTFAYQEADREAYYARQAAARRAELLQTAEIECATGRDLVNIYFRPCCEEYAGTEIALYRKKALLAVYTVAPDRFFHSIGGLADSEYAVTVKQYDKEGNVLLETDPLPFKIHPPSCGYYG